MPTSAPAAAMCDPLPPAPPAQERYLRQRELCAALEAMPAHYREAIILVAADGESYLDAAQILECGIGTRSRVNPARHILRRALEPEHLG